MISVILPIWNGEEYICECLNSLFAQTCKEYQLIVIDDGSTDRTYEICRQYEDKFDNFILVHQENRGVSVARNVGIAMASGEWITFIDVDDLIESGYLSRAEELAREHPCDMIVWDIVNISENGKKSLKEIGTENILWESSVDHRQLSEMVLCNKTGYSMSAPYAKLYRRKLIEKNELLFPEECVLCEDRYFNFRYVQYINSFYYDKSLVYLRQIENRSVTQRYRPNVFEEICVTDDSLFREMDQYYPESGEQWKNKVALSDLGYIFHGNLFHRINTKSMGEKRNELKRYLRNTASGKRIREMRCSKLHFREKIKLFLVRYRAVYLLSYVYGKSF